MRGINTGDPVVVVDGEGLAAWDIKTGDKGWANSVTSVPGDGNYVFYMPENSKNIMVIGADRLKFDEERAQMELDPDTIYKG